MSVEVVAKIKLADGRIVEIPLTDAIRLGFVEPKEEKEQGGKPKPRRYWLRKSFLKETDGGFSLGPHSVSKKALELVESKLTDEPKRTSSISEEVGMTSNHVLHALWILKILGKAKSEKRGVTYLWRKITNQ
jgi:predicted Rossmann fold nucleotide-binding protein DprA/Smf involved in DNA uptake